MSNFFQDLTSLQRQAARERMAARQSQDRAARIWPLVDMQVSGLTGDIAGRCRPQPVMPSACNPAVLAYAASMVAGAQRQAMMAQVQAQAQAQCTQGIPAWPHSSQLIAGGGVSLPTASVAPVMFPVSPLPPMFAQAMAQARWQPPGSSN